MVRLTVVSSVAASFTLDVDGGISAPPKQNSDDEDDDDFLESPDLEEKRRGDAVAHTRAILQEMLSVSSDRLKLTFKGETLSDKQFWGTLNAHDGDKLFVGVTSTSAAHQGTGIQNVPESVRKEEKHEQQKQQQRQAQSMEPMIEAMASNPGFVDMIIAMSPELKNMIRENPEVERELRNPENLKMMLRAQFDPDAKRDLDQRMASQMAHIYAVPGGPQMMERYVNGALSDSAQSGFSQRSAADLAEASEEHARPQEGKDANSEALPNPWQRQRQGGGNSLPQPGGNQQLAQFPQQQQQQQPFFNPMMMNPMLMSQMMQHQQQQQPQQQQQQYNPFFNPMLFQQNQPQQQQQLQQQQQQQPQEPLPSVEALRQRYATQLELMKEMGFEDDETILYALHRHKGDVDAATLDIAGEE